jgi:hypothetical protein
MEQGWKDWFSELNMNCAGRITLLWGSHNVQAAWQWDGRGPRPYQRNRVTLSRVTALLLFIN